MAGALVITDDELADDELMRRRAPGQVLLKLTRHGFGVTLRP